MTGALVNPMVLCCHDSHSAIPSQDMMAVSDSVCCTISDNYRHCRILVNDKVLIHNIMTVTTNMYVLNTVKHMDKV